MQNNQQSELEILRELENLIRENSDTILTETVPDGCKCKQGKTRKVFRCPGAFNINMILLKLHNLRNQ